MTPIPAQNDSLHELGNARQSAFHAGRTGERRSEVCVLFRRDRDAEGSDAKAVKRAIEAGLAPADAVRAMTLSPAEIYGVADRIGFGGQR